MSIVSPKLKWTTRSASSHTGNMSHAGNIYKFGGTKENPRLRPNNSSLGSNIIQNSPSFHIPAMHPKRSHYNPSTALFRNAPSH